MDLRLKSGLLLGLFALLSAGPSDSKDSKGPVSADAKAAIATCDRKEREAQKVFDAAVARSREEAVAALKASLNKALQRKELEEANRIKGVIDGYKLPAQPGKKSGGHREACESLSRKLAGTKWQYAEGLRGTTGHLFTFNADGSVTNGTAAWHWTAIDGQRVVLLYENGVADTFTFNEAVSEYKQTATSAGGEGWGGKRVADN